MRKIITVAVAGLVVAAATDVSAQSGTRPLEKPAWVVGDVPDTVWVLMEHAVAVGADDEDRMKEILREAEGHAREAVVDHEDNVGRRFALAAVLGMRADREGGRTKVKAASALYEELDVVLALDQDHAEAHYMMGRLHAGVRRMNGVTRWIATNLLGGDTLKKASWEEAERHLAFAVTHAPEVPDHHLQLARVYRDTGRPELAIPELEHVLAMDLDSPMEREARQEALEIHEHLTEQIARGGTEPRW
jgi:tetratricopeptide (TPR) repeat protein